MDIGKKLLSLFAGYSFCLFLSSYQDVFLLSFVPLIIAAALLPFILKFPNTLWMNIILALATAIPISTLLINLFPANHLPNLNLGFYYFSKIETATILIAMILTKLTYINLRWIQGVAKNAFFAASFLILLIDLCLKHIPGGFGYIIYVVIPFLLPMIYHVIVGTNKLFRTLSIALLSYTAAVGLDYYFVIEAKVTTTLFDSTIPGFQIIHYLIPITLLFTILIGYNPLPRSLFKKNKKNAAAKKDNGNGGSGLGSGSDSDSEYDIGYSLSPSP